MPSSLSSPSAVTEHAHSQPPSPNLHDNQRPLLSNDTARPVRDSDSDSDEEYTARFYLPVNQAGQACNDRLKVAALASACEREIECSEVRRLFLVRV
ncbi:hypothetical protein SKAU_G00298950 [Synaphobranchus kaupii]|uniref:Teneurin N-terminal domain-containing protein n=1 Tax=Synaphobranchus kaupii TaxID=118154 RepID=A0A9Q1IM41_SYNKA|nr:hypothetical protein SKAU_G00298950 [Synaphobranchus kaupii]